MCQLATAYLLRGMLEQVQQGRLGRLDVVVAGAAVGQCTAEADTLALLRSRQQRSRRAAAGIQGKRGRIHVGRPRDDAPPATHRPSALPLTTAKPYDTAARS